MNDGIDIKTTPKGVKYFNRQNMMTMLDIGDMLISAGEVRIVAATDAYDVGPRLVINQNWVFFTGTLAKARSAKELIACWLSSVRSGTNTSDLVINLN